MISKENVKAILVVAAVLLLFIAIAIYTTKDEVSEPVENVSVENLSIENVSVLENVSEEIIIENESIINQTILENVSVEVVNATNITE